MGAAGHDSFISLLSLCTAYLSSPFSRVPLPQVPPIPNRKEPIILSGNSNFENEIEKGIEDVLGFMNKNRLVSIAIIGGGLAYFGKGKIIELNNKIKTLYGDTIEKGIVVLLFFVFLYLCGWSLLKLVQYFIAKKRFTYLRILPHEADTFAYQNIISMVRSFYFIPQPWSVRLLIGKPNYSFIVQKDTDGKVAYYMGADKNLLSQAIATFTAENYKHAEIYEADGLQFLPNSNRKKVFGFHLRQKKSTPLPFKPFAYDFSTILAEQLPNEGSVQVTFRNFKMKKFRKTISSLEKEILETGDVEKKNLKLSRQKELLKDMGKRFQSDEVVYQAIIGFNAVGKESKPNLFNTYNTITSAMNDSNRLKRRRNKYATQPFQTFGERVILTGSELANLVHMPQLASDKLPKKVVEAIPHLIGGLGSLENDVMVDPIDLGLGNMQHPVIKNRFVYIQMKFIGEHLVVTGATGSGKSTVLNTLITKGFLNPFIFEKKKATSGFTFLDPARDTATTFFNWLLKAEADKEDINWDKVHYFAIANSDFPIPMNLLGRIEGVSIEVQANAITTIIENVFENKAQVAARLLRFCIQTLLADDTKVHTILEVPKLLDDEDFREELLERLSYSVHYDLLNYWRNDALDNIQTSATAVKNRIDIFSNSISMKRIFGQQENKLDVRTYMEEGHIVFFDMSNLSATEINLISSYVSYLYYRVAETRKMGSLLHLLLIDEAHRVGNVPILPKIIAESRKFGLALGIATQRLAQLPGELRGTLVNVQNNFFVCKQGSDDSKVAAENIGKVGNQFIKPTVLEQLEPREVVVKYPFEYPNKERKQQRFLVKVPPLDKYQEDGSIAPFDEKEKIAEVDEWTIKRALKLMENRDYQTSAEVDDAIFQYMIGNEKRTKSAGDPEVNSKFNKVGEQEHAENEPVKNDSIIKNEPSEAECEIVSGSYEESQINLPDEKENYSDLKKIDENKTRHGSKFTR